jgi:L-malate glycosyltransferase
MKNRVMQHVIQITGMGGPLTGYNRLINSKLSSKYHFIPLVQTFPPRYLGLNLFFDLYKKIKKENPEILHIRGLQSEGFFGVLAGKAAGCKNIVLSVHGFYFDEIELSKIKKFLFKRIVEPLTLRLADSVYCVCDYAVKRDIIQNNAKHLFGYIHNAAPNFSNLDKTQLRTDFRCGYSMNQDDVVVVTVSRISKDKGFDTLIKVIKTLKSESNLKFVIVGDGPYLDQAKFELDSEIEEGKVIFTGRLKDVSSALFGSDIFAFPSLHENLSNALLEACASSLPSVVTNIGGNPEVIINGETGFLVSPNNPEEFAKKLKVLIDSEYLRIKLGTQSNYRANTIFSEDIIFNQIDEVYCTLLNRL